MYMSIFPKYTGRLVLSSLLSCLIVTGNARAAGLQPEPPDSFEETYDDSVEVSGQLLGGLMYQGGDIQKVDVKSLHVDFGYSKLEPGEMVCIRVASRDGVYTAKWTVRLEQKQDKTPVLVSFDTVYADYLNDLDINELAVVASHSEQCGSRDAVYFPTLWGLNQEKATHLTAFLNTDATAVYAALMVKDEDDKLTAKAEIQCELLLGTDNKTNFDTICDLPFTGTDLNIESVSVVAQYDSSFDPAEVFFLNDQH